jgi:glycopeptide antibiotics resistance protein
MEFSLMSRQIAAKLAVMYLVVLFGLTLGGFYHAGAMRNLMPFRMMEHDIRKGGWEFLVNFVGNVVVMMPIGWILPFFLGRRCSTLKVAGASLALSGLIEILQGLSGRRVADVDDVILNTIGGLMCYALWVGTERWLRRVSPVDPISEQGRLPTDS